MMLQMLMVLMMFVFFFEIFRMMLSHLAPVFFTYVSARGRAHAHTRARRRACDLYESCAFISKNKTFT